MGSKARFLTFVRNDMEASHALEMDPGSEHGVTPMGQKSKISRRLRSSK